MPESFEGITVPRGEPEGLRAAATQLTGVAAALEGTGGELTSLPAAMPTWQGPASVSYAGSCMSQAGAAQQAALAMEHAALAANTYADALDDAQEDARQAIEDARDARERIREARDDIEAARAAQVAATEQAERANHVLAVSTLAGTPSPAAEADLSAAAAAGQAAAERETRAQRRLEDAEQDLERAKRRGERAERAAETAATAISGAFSGPGAVPVVMPGAPAVGPGGGAPGFNPAGAVSDYWNSLNNGRNDGVQWWNEDSFLNQTYPFAAGNDGFERGKWFVDQGAGFAAGYGSAAALGAANAARARATAPWLRTTVQSGSYRYFVAGPGGTTLVNGAYMRVTQSVGPPPAAVAARATADAARYSRYASWATRGGIGLAAIGGAVDQWHSDADNPNLTTTDRVGRAGGVGAYMGGAAMAGAAIGSVIPVGGTLVGAGVGALVGLGIGAAANAWEPGKEFAADAGQWVANAAVDTYDAVSSGVSEGLDRAQEFGSDVRDTVSEGLSDAGETISEGFDDAKDKAGEVLDDLNPF